MDASRKVTAENKPLPLARSDSAARLTDEKPDPKRSPTLDSRKPVPTVPIGNRPSSVQPPVRRRSSGTSDSEGKGQGDRPHGQPLSGGRARQPLPAWELTAEDFLDLETATARLTRTSTSAELLFRMPINQPEPEKRLGAAARIKARLTMKRGEVANTPARLGQLLVSLRQGVGHANAQIAALRMGLADTPAERDRVLLDTADSLLSNMTVREREGLHEAIRQLGDTRDPLFTTIMARIAGEFLGGINPALSPILQDELCEVIRCAGEPGDQQAERVNQAYAAARARASQGVQSGPSGDVIGRLACEIILDGLTYVLQKGAKPQDLQHLFMTLPARDLVELSEAPGQSMGGATLRHEVVILAKACLEVRQKAALRQFTDRVSEVRDWPFSAQESQVSDPARLIKCLADLAEDFKLVRSLDVPYHDNSNHDIQSLAILRFVQGRGLASFEGMERIQKLDQAFRNLDDVELKKLSSSMEVLGIAMQARGELPFGLEAVLAGRKKAALSGHMASSKAVIDALAKITAPSELTAAVHQIRLAIAERKQSRFYSGTDFSGELVRQLKQLDPAARAKLTQVLNERAFGQLLGALHEVEVSASVKETPVLPVELGELRTVLGTIFSVLVPDPPPRARLTISGLAVEVREAFQSYGIDIDTRENVTVRFGLASKNAQARLKTDLLTFRDSPPIPNAALKPDQFDYSVERDEVLDAGKYGPQPLFDDKALSRPADREAAIAAGNNRLIRLCAGNERLHSALVGFMGMRGVGPIFDVLDSADTPVRVNGMPVRPDSQARVGYEVVTDGKGGLIVTCRMKLHGATSARVIEPPGQGDMEVSARQPVTLSYSVSFDAQGVIGEPGPLQFWHGRGYATPVHAMEATQPNANPKLVTDLLEHLTSEFNQENFTIIAALNGFANNPTMDKARELVRDFIVQGAPMQANVASALREPIEAAMASGTVFEPRELIELFRPIRVEVGNLINRDAFPRFLAKVKAQGELDRREAAAADAAAAAAVAEVIPGPPPDDSEAARTIARDVRSAALTLARPLVVETERDFGFKLMNKAREAIVEANSVGGLPLPGTSERSWAEAEMLIGVTVGEMPKAAVASLLYNLSVMPAAEGDAGRIAGMLRLAANRALAGTVQGRMTPEGVLVANPQGVRLTPALVDGWFRRGRINESELIAALSTFPNGMLKMLVDSAETHHKVRETAQKLYTGSASQGAPHASRPEPRVPPRPERKDPDAGDY
ncbi:MAG: hypothetical protein V4684_10590 [Pseudomonadota bacterium]